MTFLLFKIAYLVRLNPNWPQNVEKQDDDIPPSCLLESVPFLSLKVLNLQGIMIETLIERNRLL